MSKKTKYAVAAILIAASFFLFNKNEKTVLNYDKLTVTFSEKYVLEEHDGQQYVIIPINTDLTKVSVIVRNEKEILNVPMVHDFMLSIDTFVPKEYIGEFDIANKKIVIKVIVR